MPTGGGMRQMERVIAALLLAVAVIVGGVLIPRLLSGPAIPLGVPVAPSPVPVVVHGSAIPKAPRHSTLPHATPTPARAAAGSLTPIVRGVRVAAQPAPNSAPAPGPTHNPP